MPQQITVNSDAGHLFDFRRQLTPLSHQFAERVSQLMVGRNLQRSAAQENAIMIRIAGLPVAQAIPQAIIGRQ